MEGIRLGKSELEHQRVHCNHAVIIKIYAHHLNVKLEYRSVMIITPLHPTQLFLLLEVARMAYFTVIRNKYALL